MDPNRMFLLRLLERPAPARWVLESAAASNDAAVRTAAAAVLPADLLGGLLDSEEQPGCLSAAVRAAAALGVDVIRLATHPQATVAAAAWAVLRAVADDDRIAGWVFEVAAADGILFEERIRVGADLDVACEGRPSTAAAVTATAPLWAAQVAARWCTTPEAQARVAARVASTAVHDALPILSAVAQNPPAAKVWSVAAERDDEVGAAVRWWLEPHLVPELFTRETFLLGVIAATARHVGAERIPAWTDALCAVMENPLSYPTDQAYMVTSRLLGRRDLAFAHRRRLWRVCPEVVTANAIASLGPIDDLCLAGEMGELAGEVGGLYRLWAACLTTSEAHGAFAAAVPTERTVLHRTLAESKVADVTSALQLQSSAALQWFHDPVGLADFLVTAVGADRISEVLALAGTNARLGEVIAAVQASS